ncbi:MAG: TerD family protein [Candidatus Saccharibacteria bacterium]
MCCSPHTFRGGNISLSSRAKDLGLSGGLTVVTIGLGWDKQDIPGDGEFDLDASAIALTKGKCPNDTCFVFYGNLVGLDGCITHTGDNTTGEGDGDDEQIIIDLTKVPDTIDSIVIPVSIYDAKNRGQHFGMVSQAYIRLLGPNGDTFTRYDLELNAWGMTSMVFGELYRTPKRFFGRSEWKFRAIGQGYDTGLQGIALDYGVNVLQG